MKGSVLVVDDEKEIRDFFKENLTEAGWKVLTASGGEIALSLLREESPDLVLLDIKMPGMDGIKVLQKIKESRSDAIVIILTGYGTTGTAREAMKLGAYDYITKPFDLNLVKDLLREALGEKVA